ncbi:armadillo-type protein [Mycena alexandri]|uniref:Armadillo-type protein n=1 Tax=Mycena alexandri TaxID=1745969 RepID=A0AAD6WW99_9AGAR|nr:armadillo-type protein [Mycena alexandri]
MKTEEWVVIEIDRIAQESVKDLRNADWDIRIAGLESLTQLVKTGKISNNKIIGEGQNIMACTTFFDEDVRLSAIRTLQELAKHERFHRIIDDNMDDILGLVSDDDSSVRAAAVDFVYELAGQVAFQRAINRNLPAFITENYGWQPGFARCGRLQALGKIIESGRSYDNGIQRAFGDLLTWLSDGQDVCQTALQIISLAAEHRVFWAKIEEAIPEIAKLFETEGNNEDVRVAALRTCAGVARVAEASFLQKLSAVIPIITKLFKSKDKGVRLAAFETCAEIAKTQPAALQNTINNIMTEILRALNSTHGGHTQIAALHTLSTFAELDDLRDNLDDNVISKIISGLLDDDDDVQTQTLDTLAVLASKEQFHNNVKGATQNILPLLEDRRWWIRQKALDTFAVFALNGILDSDDEITTRIISMLSEGDTDASASVLNILYIAAKQDVTPVMHPEILVATTLLSHPNSRVRVAALEVLQSLADDPAYEKINFPALTTIMNCISNETEGVQVAGLRTMFKFIDVEIFRDRGTVPETVLKVISSLLQSSSEDTRISVIGIISSYSTKAEFFSTIQSVIPTITKLLKDPDGSSDTRVIIIRTLCDMAKTDNLWTGSDVFVESVGDTLRSLLSDNQDAAVRIAALQIVPVITQHNAFREIGAQRRTFSASRSSAHCLTLLNTTVSVKK